MKKKIFCLFIVAFIAANMFLSTPSSPWKESQLSLALLQARADEPAETDPTDPDEEYPPARSFPSDWTLSAIIDYFF